MLLRRVSAISAAISVFFIVICAIAVTTPLLLGQARAERSKLWQWRWLGNSHVVSYLDSDGIADGRVRFGRDLFPRRADQASLTRHCAAVVREAASCALQPHCFTERPQENQTLAAFPG
jgi:hypothetical protein